MENFVFKEDLCDAEFNLKEPRVFELSCCKGRLCVQVDDVVQQFKAYHNWCLGCKKKKVVSKSELQKAFKQISDNILRECDVNE